MPIRTRHLEPKYKLRARFMGMVYWICPYCGRPNASQILTDTFLVWCRGDGGEYGCKRRFAVGLRLLVKDRMGPAGRPDDYVLPDDLAEAFPEGDLGHWRTRYPVHMLVIEKVDGTALEEFVEELNKRVERTLTRARGVGVTVDGEVGQSKRWMVIGQLYEQMTNEWRTE